MNTEVDRNWYQSVLFRPQMDTITRGAKTSIASIVHFDNVPTGWVSKHCSVGQIQLQSRHAYAVAVPYSVGCIQYSVGAPTLFRILL
jgi:hypothetical protein